MMRIGWMLLKSLESIADQLYQLSFGLLIQPVLDYEVFGGLFDAIRFIDFYGFDTAAEIDFDLNPE
jgi:hypothetical protein